VKIRRTGVIRAVAAGVQASGIDLTGYGIEGDIAAATQARLQREMLLKPSIPG